MEIQHEEGTVVKRSTDAAEDARLRREAELLIAARHVGVVALIESGVDGERRWLRLADAGGVTLASMLDTPVDDDDDLLGLLAELATTVADLHEIGIVHGAIEPDHVLVDGSGRPLLCSFGRGGKVGERDAAVDVRALAALVGRVLPLSRTSSLVARAEASGSARQIADAIVEELRSGRRSWMDADHRVLRRRLPASSPADRRRRISLPAAGAALGVLGVGVLALDLVSSGRPAHRATPTAPAAAAGSVLFSYAQGVLSVGGNRYAVGLPGDQVAVGRWSCGAPEVAMLRTDGSIYLFDGMATPGTDREGRLIGTATGASWLRATRNPATGCDSLIVGGTGGSATVPTPAP